MLEYQKQNTCQTLAEGIAEYFAANGKHFGTRKMTPEAETFFKCHDTAHVVFGCDISLDDEAIVKISSMFGTTAGLGVMNGYKLAESKEVYEDLKFLDIVGTTLKSFVLVPRTMLRCARMRKRWQWDEFELFLSKPLNEIRREFGIRVAH